MSEAASPPRKKTPTKPDDALTPAKRAPKIGDLLAVRLCLDSCCVNGGSTYAVRVEGLSKRGWPIVKLGIGGRKSCLYKEHPGENNPRYWYLWRADGGSVLV